MALFNLADLLAMMPPNARLIGLDPGARRIGVALSDVNRQIASPYGVIDRAKLRQNAAEISALAQKEGAGGLIVGMALDNEQKLGSAAQSARDWAHAMSAATGLPACMQDESLTTQDAHATLIDSANMGREKRARLVDQMAAANILQAALDKGQTQKKAAN